MICKNCLEQADDCICEVIEKANSDCLKSHVEHCVLVLDEESGHEAIYIGGELIEHCFTIHCCDIATACAGKTVQISHVVVEMPANMPFPQQFEKLMPWMTLIETPEQPPDSPVE